MQENLIFRNLDKDGIIGKDLILNRLRDNRQITGYIGFAPTGQIHLGYLIPCMKIRDFTLAGCNVAILIADIHAQLDERKTPPELVEYRSIYYQLTLTKILNHLGANIEKIKFIKGSQFQLSPTYNMSLLQMASKVTINAAKKAGTEVVKQNKDPNLGSLIYPLMQSIDEMFIGLNTFNTFIDFELGGLDQRKIFCFSRDNKSEDNKISYLMNPIISLTKSGKMSASEAQNKISLNDSDNDIILKINKAFCCDGEPDCGLMTLMKCVLLPFYNEIVIECDDKLRTYDNFDNIHDDFIEGKFVGSQLKSLISKYLIKLIIPIRKYILEDMKEIINNAYPTN